MLRKRFLMFCFLLAAMVLTASQGQCENWKEYFKDSDGTYYYDKDSNHYHQKKKVFGLMVRNKEIINVWLRCISKEKSETSKYLLTINCATRKFQSPDFGMFADLVCNYNEYARPDNRIGPGDPLEGLLKKVCP